MVRLYQLVFVLLTFGYHNSWFARASTITDLKEHINNTQLACLRDDKKYFAYYDAQNPTQLQNYTFQLQCYEWKINEYKLRSSTNCTIELDVTVVCEIPSYPSPRNIKIHGKHIYTNTSIYTKAKYFNWGMTTCKCKSTPKPTTEVEIIENDGKNYYYSYNWENIRLTEYSLFVSNKTGKMETVGHTCQSKRCSSKRFYVDPCTVGKIFLHVRDKSCTDKSIFNKSVLYAEHVNKTLENTTCQITQSAINIAFNPLVDPGGFLYNVNISRNGTILFSNITNSSHPIKIMYYGNFLSSTEEYVTKISPCLSCGICLHPTTVKCVKVTTLPTNNTKFILNSDNTESSDVESKWIIGLIVVSSVSIVGVALFAVFYCRKSKHDSSSSASSSIDSLEKPPNSEIFPRDEPHIYEEILDFHPYASFSNKKEEEEKETSQKIENKEMEVEESHGSSLSDDYV